MSTDSRLSRLENEYNGVVQRLRHFETLEDMREKSVFSVSLKPGAPDLSKDDNILLGENIRVYISSPYYDASKCRFTAPVTGSYFFEMAVRQTDDKGEMDGFLCYGDDMADMTFARVARTTGKNSMQGKGLVLKLTKGQFVVGVVKKLSGSAKVDWAGMSGYLVTGSSGLRAAASGSQLPATPSAPTIVSILP